MKKHACHILVVGAGPAGTCAAARAAREGLKVIVVERRAIVGVPIRCAEYIPAPLMGELDVDRQFVVQSVRGMRTMLPGGEVRETRAPGFMISFMSCSRKNRACGSRWTSRSFKPWKDWVTPGARAVAASAGARTGPSPKAGDDPDFYAHQA